MARIIYPLYNLKNAELKAYRTLTEAGQRDYLYSRAVGIPHDEAFESAYVIHSL